MRREKMIILSLLLGLSVLYLPLLEAFSQYVPLPEGIEITAPSQDVPKEIAAFSGTWQGVWDGQLDSILIVVEIDSEEAKVIYAWGDNARFNIRKGFSNHIAKVPPGSKPKIEWGDGKKSPKFEFSMRKNLKELWGTRYFKGMSSTILMKKDVQ